jgi:hypothetical protein
MNDSICAIKLFPSGMIRVCLLNLARELEMDSGAELGYSASKDHLEKYV